MSRFQYLTNEMLEQRIKALEEMADKASDASPAAMLLEEAREEMAWRRERGNG